MRTVALLVLSTVVLAACGSGSTATGSTPTSDPACDELRGCCARLADPQPCVALADSWEGSPNAGDLCRVAMVPYLQSGACSGTDSGAGGAGGSSGSSGVDGGSKAGAHAGGQGGNGGLSADCKKGLTDCEGVCADLNASVDHCGSCPTRCGPEESCDLGKCKALPKTCPCPVESYCDLGTNMCKSGCLTDPNCSAGRYCDTTTRTCKPGCRGSEDCDQAQNQLCGAASHQCECVPGTHACAGTCLSDTSPEHCGSLCTPCPTPDNGAVSCDGQTCNSSCEQGYHHCGDACLSNTSPASCGTRCDPCPDNDPHGDANCSATGACQIICQSGYHICSGTCVSNSEIAHCGTACNPCPNSDSHGTAVCTQSGQCDMKCQQGYLPYQGACCLPKSCEAGGKNCGSMSDGCGHTLTCGTCSGSDTCGGTGTLNVCGGGCTDDYEPNNSESTRTKFEAIEYEGYAYLTATICNNDQDYFLARLVYQSAGCNHDQRRELLLQIDEWPDDAQVTIEYEDYYGNTLTKVLSKSDGWDRWYLYVTISEIDCSPNICSPTEIPVRITATTSQPVRYKLTAGTCI